MWYFDVYASPEVHMQPMMRGGKRKRHGTDDDDDDSSADPSIGDDPDDSDKELGDEHDAPRDMVGFGTGMDGPTTCVIILFAFVVFCVSHGFLHCILLAVVFSLVC